MYIIYDYISDYIGVCRNRYEYNEYQRTYRNIVVHTIYYYIIAPLCVFFSHQQTTTTFCC